MESKQDADGDSSSNNVHAIIFLLNLEYYATAMYFSIFLIKENVKMSGKLYDQNEGSSSGDQVILLRNVRISVFNREFIRRIEQSVLTLIPSI